MYSYTETCIHAIKTKNVTACIKPHILIVGDVNTLLSPLDTSVRQKINREIRELTDVMTQMDLTDIYRTFHLNIKEYTFSSAPH